MPISPRSKRSEQTACQAELHPREQTITIPTSATVVAFDKAPADQLAVGRKVFVVMKKDGSEAAAVVIGAEGVKPPM